MLSGQRWAAWAATHGTCELTPAITRVVSDFLWADPAVLMRQLPRFICLSRRDSSCDASDASRAAASALYELSLTWFDSASDPTLGSMNLPRQRGRPAG